MQQVEVHVEGENIGALVSPFTVGRDPECDVILPDSSVSRRHLKVTVTGGGLLVEDMGSSNGTWLDGRRIAREVVPSGQPFVVGRVSMSLHSVMGGVQAPAYEGPASRGNGHGVPSGTRSETLAVDIPQGFFDPAPPPMRTFDCPGCGRRLRCAARTRRVKCRNCDEIIRFEGEQPMLERHISSPSPSPSPAQPAPPPPPRQMQPPAPQYQRPQAPVQQVERRAVVPVPDPISSPIPEPSMAPKSPQSDAWVEQAKAEVDRRAHQIRGDESPSPRAELMGPRSEQSILQALPNAAGGKAALWVLLAGTGIAAVSLFIYIAGVDRMLPFIIVGGMVALAGFVYAAAAWIRSGSAGGARPTGGVEERLHRLNRLRGENLITEDEYAVRRRDILRDL